MWFCSLTLNKSVLRAIILRNVNNLLIVNGKTEAVIHKNKKKYEFAQCSVSQGVELNAQELVYFNFITCQYVGDKEFKFNNGLICNVSINKHCCNFNNTSIICKCISF
jgi:hypothetical protein